MTLKKASLCSTIFVACSVFIARPYSQAIAASHHSHTKSRSKAEAIVSAKPDAPLKSATRTKPHTRLMATQAETVNVQASHRALGGGMMERQTVAKTISSVNQEYISKQSPLVNPGVLVSSLPGVQGNNEGPLSTTSETIHIRGLDQTQIGMVYEGMPLADPFTYGAYTSAMVDNENMASVSVSQGSSDLTAPTYNADGAQMTLNLRHPSKKFGAYVEASGGTHSTNKEFIRVDTGEIGHSGVTGFVSGSYSSANLWRGPGDMYRWHIDAALEKQWGRRSSSELIFSYNYANQTEWLYPTLAQWHEYGDSYNTSSKYTAGNTSYYKLNTKATNAIVGTIKNHFDFGSGLTLDAQPYAVETYGPNNYGVSIPTSNGYFGSEKYSNLDGYSSGSGNVTAISIHPWVQTSSGLNLIGAWKKGNNTVKFSYWYSYVVHTEYQNHYVVDSHGGYSENNGYLKVGGRALTQYDINGMQQSNTLALEDELRLFHDRLTINAGLRTNMISRQFTENLPGADPYKSVKNMFIPAPQLLISYKIDPENQIYINGTTGYRAPSSFQSQVATYSFTSPVVASSPLSDYRPEYMIGEEIGFRHYGPIMFNVSGFNYNLTHHQISSSTYLPNSTLIVSQPIDAGGETARGVQAEISTRPWHHISAYASGQYMHTSVGNNIAYGGDYFRTKGKQEVASPKFLAALGLTYDDGTTFGNFNFRYSDSQYSTLMNDQGIPAYFTADLSFGRYLPKVGRFHPKAMLSLTNLGDVHYLSSMTGYSVTAAKSITGIYGKTVSGSNPSYNVGSGFAAVVTIAGTFE
ncbi:TonB-dependent receptor [Acetobacter nitrogenifigens]|uniref:Ligand-gated channel n=1 Tax=Acetobacter nitrogenifigens DSM 23921 = NBRC 105050 TaxID=1120919 RepID=A0A511XD22_9PROT|nr:TonB-dependent receptor [Acetobacter nitrogenifigens]GEN60775.1 ligand-gated channel [Acetobacter nitrogenifigens DSM 23921 = NBRC 105050]